MTTSSRKIGLDVKAAKDFSGAAGISPCSIHSIVQSPYYKRGITQKVSSPVVYRSKLVFKRPGASFADNKIHESHTDIPFIFFNFGGRMAKEVNFYTSSILKC
jgi:hypothetical protein